MVMMMMMVMVMVVVVPLHGKSTTNITEHTLE
jgi:hypothetical protein